MKNYSCERSFLADIKKNDDTKSCKAKTKEKEAIAVSSPLDTSKFLFHRDTFIADFTDYLIEATDNHYSNGSNVQVLDLIQSSGMLESFALGNVLKYMSRYPKTKSRKDLLKAVHYIMTVYEKG